MPVDMGWGEIAGFASAIAASGVVSGLLAGIFGIGGGAVLVPVFYQVFGLLGVDESVRMHLSVGSSLAIIIPTVDPLVHGAPGARASSTWSCCAPLLVPVPVGVVLASLVAAYISSEGLRVIFAVARAARSALRLLFNRESWRLGTEIPGNPWRAIIGVVIGFFSTLMGIGGGIMNNTFMTLYGRPHAPGRGDVVGRRRADRHPRHHRLHLGRLGQSAAAGRLDRLYQLDRRRADHADRADRHALWREDRALAVEAASGGRLRAVLPVRVGALLRQPLR